MSASPPLFVVLAAGKGTRMKSALPKVLHKIAGQSMLAHVLSAASDVDGRDGRRRRSGHGSRCAARLGASCPAAQVFVQTAQQGTADAVLAARPALDGHKGDVVVLYADTPLIRTETLKHLQAAPRCWGQRCRARVPAEGSDGLRPVTDRSQRRLGRDPRGK